MTLCSRLCPSPLGPLELVADMSAAIVSVRFVAGDYAGYPGPRRLPDRDVEPDEEGRLEPACRQLDEYFAGARRRFGLPLALRGTPFQMAAWQAIVEIPFGETRTYADVAAILGRPAAARAVGRASAMNRLPILVPCHRLVGRDGALHGYAGGLDLKRRLLGLENPGQASTHAHRTWVGGT